MEKPRILILYFSGTGNTYFVSKFIQANLSGGNCDKADLFSIEDISGCDIAKYDFVILGFPIYGCEAPDILNEFIKGIKLVSLKKGFVFCTKAMYSGNAARNLIRRLRNIGFMILGYDEIVMPGSDGITFLNKNSSYMKKLSAKDFFRTKGLHEMVKKIQLLINSYRQAKEIRVAFNPVRFLMTSLFKIFIPITNRMKKKFYADDNCFQCGICIRICPQKNIIATNRKINFDNKCILCMRCINYCPNESIQIGGFTEGKARWKGPYDIYYSEVLLKK